MKLLYLAILFHSTLSLTQAIESRFTLESKNPIEGDSIGIVFIFQNFERSPESIRLPSSIEMRVIGPQESATFQVALSPLANQNQQVVQPFSSISAVYTGSLPNGIVGPVAIESHQSRIIATIQSRSSEFEKGPPEDSHDNRETQRVDPLRELNENPHLWIGGESDLISIYEPTYFDIGASEFLNSKFQVSLKYRLFSPAGALSQRNPWTSNLYFRYTQTSLWDLESVSAPFIDTSYKPGFFYFHTFRDSSGPLKSIEVGVHHESNGRDGPESRSTNYIYAKPIFKWDFGELYLSTGAKIWAYVENDDATNADIARYWGNLDAFFAFGKTGNYQFVATARIGDQWDKGRLQLEFFYPLHKVGFENIPIHLHASYFYGYGESLLRYDKKDPSQFRIGFSLSQY